MGRFVGAEPLQESLFPAVVGGEAAHNSREQQTSGAAGPPPNPHRVSPDKNRKRSKSYDGRTRRPAPAIRGRNKQAQERRRDAGALRAVFRQAFSGRGA